MHSLEHANGILDAGLELDRAHRQDVLLVGVCCLCILHWKVDPQSTIMHGPFVLPHHYRNTILHESLSC